MDDRDAAECKDAVLPEPFEWVTEDLNLPLPWGVGRVKDNGGFCFQESCRNSITRICLRELVRNSRAKDTVNPAFQDRGGHPPPVGMDNNDPVGCGNLGAMLRDIVGKLCITGDLFGMEKGIKRFCLEIMDRNGMTGIQERTGCCRGDCMIETSWPGMCKDEGDFHGIRPVISVQLP